MDKFTAADARNAGKFLVANVANTFDNPEANVTFARLAKYFGDLADNLAEAERAEFYADVYGDNAGCESCDTY